MPTWIDEVLGSLILALAWFVKRTMAQNDKRHEYADERLAKITATLASIDGGLSQIHERQDAHEKRDDERFAVADKTSDRIEAAILVIHNDIKKLLERKGES